MLQLRHHLLIRPRHDLVDDEELRAVDLPRQAEATQLCIEGGRKTPIHLLDTRMNLNLKVTGVLQGG